MIPLTVTELAGTCEIDANPVRDVPGVRMDRAEASALPPREMEGPARFSVGGRGVTLLPEKAPSSRAAPSGASLAFSLEGRGKKDTDHA